MFLVSITDVIRIHCYDCRLEDYASFRDELVNFIDDTQTILDILDYKIGIY